VTKKSLNQQQKLGGDVDTPDKGQGLFLFHEITSFWVANFVTGFSISQLSVALGARLSPMPASKFCPKIFLEPQKSPPVLFCLTAAVCCSGESEQIPKK